MLLTLGMNFLSIKTTETSTPQTNQQSETDGMRVPRLQCRFNLKLLSEEGLGERGKGRLFTLTPVR